ncbi:MAG: nickel pincer cofactor biosynthesis protein LarC [Cyanobium sp.]|nr:nickel pincer cofactor biosynthesis protein LarC [Cyanobium sp.]
MVLALVDCPTGLAGNMLLAALFDLGVPRQVVNEPLAALGLASACRLVIEERRSRGLRGLHLDVQPLEAHPPHRLWRDLRGQLERAPLEPALRERVLAVFSLLADAEGTVHGIDPDRVHFHEVGAVDALVDVVGVCAGLLHLGVERLTCTVPPAGHGTVCTAHGLLPVPVPAVLEIARRRGVPLAGSGDLPAGELTTPTGMALMATWADAFALPPTHRPLALGVGLGSRELDRPNLLRIVLSRAVDASDPAGRVADPAAGPDLQMVVEQQAQIDDATPEDLAVLLDSLRTAGALEVFCQSISMKKDRPGWLITALSTPGAAAEALRQVWWRHGTTLGVRESLQQRWALPRRVHILQTSLGPVRLKQALLPDGRWRSKPEHADLLLLAHRHGLALDQVRATVVQQIGQLPPPSSP